MATIIDLLISKNVISPKAQEAIRETFDVLAHGAQKLNEAVVFPIFREVDATCEVFPDMGRRDALDFVLAGYKYEPLVRYFKDNPDVDRYAFFESLDEYLGDQ